MKRTLSTLILIATSASTAFASTAAEGSGFGLVTLAFLGFFALIIATQLVPALMLLVGIVQGATGATDPSAR